MIIDTSCMDREVAVLIFNNKIYEHDNHQFALKEAMDDAGIEFYSYDYIDSNIDDFAVMTDEKSKNNEIFTFDNFDNKYLIAHYKDNLFLNLDIIKEYAKNNNLKIGYFEDMNSDDAVVLNL